MSGVPFMPFFCGDYLKDTTGLSLEENGAYLKILMITWAQGGNPLPDDDGRMANHLSITRERWAKRLKPVLAQFFDLSGGTWRNERLEREWAKTQAKIAARKEAGARGGRARWNGPGNDPNSPQPSHCNLPPNSETNPRKNNETAKANASRLLKQNGSTHIHTSTDVEESEDDARAQVQVREVVERVAAMSGVPVGKKAQRDGAFAEAAGWLERGADPEIDIYPAVGDVMNRTKYTHISTLRYFTKEIGAQHAARLERAEGETNVEHIRSGQRRRKPDAGERNAALMGPLARSIERLLDSGSASAG